MANANLIGQQNHRGYHAYQVLICSHYLSNRRRVCKRNAMIKQLIQIDIIL